MVAGAPLAEAAARCARPGCGCWPPTAPPTRCSTRRRHGRLAGPTAWLFGNEAWGLPADLLALADEAVAVPIYGRAESLNLAAAAAVCLYASAARLNSPRVAPDTAGQTGTDGAVR